MQSSPIVIAIREAAADLAPLRRLLRQPDVLDTPVQDADDPALCNSFPLHVAVAECCVPALEVLLPITPLGTFYRVDGFQQTAVMIGAEAIERSPHWSRAPCTRALTSACRPFFSLRAN